MTPRPWLYLYPATEGERSALLRCSNGAMFREWLKANGIPALRTPTGRGWYARAERVPDIVARAERDGFRVHVKGARP